VSGLSSTATDGFLQSLADSSIIVFEAGFSSTLPESFPPKVKSLCKELSIHLNLHLPFFFSWSDQHRINQSKRILAEGARLAAEVDGIAVFHLGYAGNLGFGSVRSTITSAIRETAEHVASMNTSSQFCLGIETSGKISELGSLEEIIDLVGEVSSIRVIPVIDWSHLYARADGRFPRSIPDYRQVMTKLESVSSQDFYFHGSGIEFKNSQEKRHLSAKTCLPPLPHLLKVLEEGGYRYTLIVESPTAIEDVLWLKDVCKDPSAWIEFAERKMREVAQQATLD